MKVQVKQSNKPQLPKFPCLMKNPTNNMVLLVTGELCNGYQGVCVVPDDKKFNSTGQIRIGTGGHTWNKKDFVLCDDVIELSN